MDACWLLGPPVIHLSHTIHKWHKINYEAVAALKKKIENWKLRSKSKTCFDSPREREGVWLLWGCGWYNFVRNEGVRTEKELVFIVMMKHKKRLKRGGGGGFASETRTRGGKTKRKERISTLRLRLYLWWIMISPLLPSFWWVSFLPCK